MNTRHLQIIQRFRDANRSDNFISYTASQPTLPAAIDTAAMSRDEKQRKYPHQFRRSDAELTGISRALQERVSEIASVKDFHSLLNLFDKVVSHGFGLLTKYDIAIRIAAHPDLDFAPEFIYLHTGTRIGAKLLNAAFADREFIRKEDLPEAFAQSDLSPAELEDLLCLAHRASDPALNDRAFKEALNYIGGGCCDCDDDSRHTPNHRSHPARRANIC